MVEAELLIGRLRRQVRDLQSLLNYLESREMVGREDYSYSRAKLREVIRRLRDVERWSSVRGGSSPLEAEWLN